MRNDFFMPTTRRAVLLYGFASLVLASCRRMGIGFTKIADVLAKPENYAEKEIRIEGRVTNVLKLPFISTKLYAMQDASGQINIRTDREAPLPGAKVRVIGVLDTVAVVGEQNLGVHLHELERW